MAGQNGHANRKTESFRGHLFAQGGWDAITRWGKMRLNDHDMSVFPITLSICTPHKRGAGWAFGANDADGRLAPAPESPEVDRRTAPHI